MRDLTIGSCRASLFLSAAFVLILGAEPGYPGEKVTLCHFPPGNPADAHTIAVGEPALDAHLDHGDALGECAEPSSCGDGVVQGTEGCDGTDLGGHTCEDVLAPGAAGTPSCTAACELAPGTCQLCGNGIVEGTEECDGEVSDPENFACLPAGHENACRIVAINPI